MAEQLKKKSKRSSVVWNHYLLSDCKTKVTCLHCGQQFAYTSTAMSNLSRHIKRKHPEVNMDDNILNNGPLQVCTVDDAVDQGGNFSLKSYEITMESFEELGQENSDKSKDTSDPDWLPEAEENIKLKTSDCGPSKSKKSKKHKSMLWNHFEKSSCGSFGKCVHCGISIKLGSISNLARHLRHKHPTLGNVRANFIQGSAKRTKVNDENMLDKDVSDYDTNIAFTDEIEVSSEFYNEHASDSTGQFNCDPQIDESYSIKFSCPEEVQPNTTQESQTECLLSDEFNMCDYLKPKTNLVVSEQVDCQLVKMIVKGCHPLKIVEQVAFKDFVTLLNPRYCLPDSNKICQELIPALYKDSEKNAINSLKEAEGICLFLDVWVSRRTCYMSISAHIVNRECKLESLFLSCHILSATESSAEISKRLLQTIAEWEITDKVVAVTTDNTPSLLDAAKLCQWTHIPSFVKALNLVLFECLQDIKSLVNKVKAHVEYLTRNSNQLAKVYSIQKSLKLPQVRLFIPKIDCNWNSNFATLDMLTRYVKLKSAIINPDLPGTKPSDGEWRILTSAVDILGLFKVIKQEVLTEGKVTLAKVAFYLKTLQKETIKFQQDITHPNVAIHVAAIAEKLLNSFFKDVQESDLIKKSLLLDPRLKKHVFVDESESADACSKLKKEVCEIILPDQVYEESSSSSLWFAFDSEVKKLYDIKDPIGKGMLEFENYLQEQLLPRSEDPLLWWNERKSIYPRLYKLAKRYLCVTTKPPVRESISYRCAYMLNNLKNSGPKNLESEVMFLYHNM